jgi:hypothetical protein
MCFRLQETLDRTIDQILSDIPESDHIDVTRGVVELIEGHTEEEVKYTHELLQMQVQLYEVRKENVVLIMNQ